MADMLLHPAYPDWAVEAYKKDWIHEIEQPEANLDNFARPLYAAAFGPSHPLGPRTRQRGFPPLPHHGRRPHIP